MVVVVDRKQATRLIQALPVQDKKEGRKMSASSKTLEVAFPSQLESTDAQGTPAAEPAPTEAWEQAMADENLYLIGRPTLKGFLRFVQRHAVNSTDQGTLADEWRAAKEAVRSLQREEAGVADGPSIGKMGPEYEPLLLDFLRDPLVRHGFNTVPTQVAFVELDRLVVYQKRIDLTFVRQLESKLGPAPSQEQVFRFCLPFDHPQPPVKWCRVHPDKYVFVSPSNDLRFLGVMPLEPSHLKDYQPHGNLVSVVGIAVGFGPNFLNAVYAENRLILNNGNHRAYALRNLGITHAPCIIQHVSTRDELDVVAASRVRSDPDLYLKHPRPMMLKDYFNPKLHKALPVHRRLRQVVVQFAAEESYAPGL